MSTRLATRTDLALDFPALDKLMPMNVRLDGAGRILGFGPTMAKLFPAISLIGTSFFSIFEIRRPAGLTSMAQLRARSGMKMHLALTATEPAVTFTGLALPVAEGQGMILNLSFGIAVIEEIEKVFAG